LPLDRGGFHNKTVKILSNLQYFDLK